jgi:hypothetical protein
VVHVSAESTWKPSKVSGYMAAVMEREVNGMGEVSGEDNIKIFPQRARRTFYIYPQAALGNAWRGDSGRGRTAEGGKDAAKCSVIGGKSSRRGPVQPGQRKNRAKRSSTTSCLRRVVVEPESHRSGISLLSIVVQIKTKKNIRLGKQTRGILGRYGDRLTCPFGLRWAEMGDDDDNDELYTFRALRKHGDVKNCLDVLKVG